MTRILTLAVLFLVLAPAMRAQAPGTPASAVLIEQTPEVKALTIEQKLQVLNASKDVEIAMLKLDAARTAMQQLVTAVTPAGYTLNDRLDLVPVPVKPADVPKKPSHD